MPVVLKFQSTGSIPGNGDPVAMNGASLTMGRGAENDLVLPDPDRVLSKRHCAIEDHNGNVVVVDISTNGTFLNYGKLPLGATPTPINDGDILSVGPYEIMVSIVSVSEIEALPDPVAEEQVSHGSALEAPSPADLLDAPGDGGDFLDDLLSGRDGPVGPGSVDRAEADDDGLLPPLPGDEGILPPAEDPFGGQGASAGSHNPATSDFFSAPSAQNSPSAIPDDWDDDFLKPAPTAAPKGGPVDPFGGGGTSTGVTMPPTDFGKSSDQSPPAPQTPPSQAIIPEHTMIGLPSDPPLAPPPTEPPKPSPPPSAAPPSAPEPAPAPAAAPAPAPKPEPAPAPAPQKPVLAEGGADKAARAFLDALGAEDVAISDEQLTPTLSRMGHVLRIMIEGMREILMTRSSIKSEFRIEQTMIQAGGNNPLKFSISPEQAVEAMVRPKTKGYLDATDATTQALDDIKAHEVAMITGMEAALKGVLKKLDPVVLGDKIAKDGGLTSLLKSKKARYWEIYEDMYAEISDQAENDFQELFAKEFARAYQQQLDKLK